jgi:hypothetical protein
MTRQLMCRGGSVSSYHALVCRHDREELVDPQALLQAARLMALLYSAASSVN